MTHLLLTVRFLDERYHGLLDRSGPPEWPPSPYRLFQALVAGVARRGELVVGEDVPSNRNFTPVGEALGWLQRHSREHPPVIVSPKSKPGQAISRFVPNNDGDKKFDRQDRLTAKYTQPTLFLLTPGQKPEVHYIWDVPSSDDCPIDDIERTARSLTTLGWGIDMAFADARLVNGQELNHQFDLEEPSYCEERDPKKRKWIVWYPKKNAGLFRDTLRMPTYDDELGECTLCDLRHSHSTFINRIEHGKPLKTVEKPKVFDRVLYTSVERLAGRRGIVFKLVSYDGNGDEQSARYPQPLLAHIAAVVRHAAIESMGKDGGNAPRWIPKSERAAWVCRFVRGKKGPGDEPHQQISYVPLPSIGHEHSDAMIRNVMLIAPIGCERELEYVAECIDGVTLEFKDKQDDGETRDPATGPAVPLPHTIHRFKPPKGKFIETRYLGRSRIWQSVTPVILDEHIDKKTRETKEGQKVKYRDEEDFKRLIRLALERTGIETPCIFTWQTVPFYKNCLSAHRHDRNKRPNYVPPKRLDGKTAIHLRLNFEHEVPGPITLGAGRHCGFGLMAATD